MKGKLRYREGLPADEVAQVDALVKTIDPYNWSTREQAAATLRVGVRTIDRYIRRGELTAYSGMLPGGGYGVRLWEPDVRRHGTVTPTVVKG
jgi:hypothetical protein